MFKLPADLKAKGEAAEAAFRAWLNQESAAFLYIEQSPLNVPAPLRGKIKRPDYLVGLPGVGMVAFDVKAKSTYDDCLLFEAGELKKLSRFSGFFNVTVLFACLDLDTPERFVWVSLQDLLLRPVERRGRAAVVAVPVAEAFTVSAAEPFMEAFFRFGRQALEV